jgi:hypothetical protein
MWYAATSTLLLREAQSGTLLIHQYYTYSSLFSGGTLTPSCACPAMLSLAYTSDLLVGVLRGA